MTDYLHYWQIKQNVVYKKNEVFATYLFAFPKNKSKGEIPYRSLKKKNKSLKSPYRSSYLLKPTEETPKEDLFYFRMKKRKNISKRDSNLQKTVQTKSTKKHVCLI